MQRWRFTALLLLLIGCAGGGSFWVVVEFPAGYQDDASILEVYAIAPTGGASCGALEEGTALPDDAEYGVEDTVSMALPVQAGARQLEGIGPGRRLFFAQAKDDRDTIILTGCTEAQATGGSGVQEVLIKLGWTCRVTNGGVEICDDIDNNCDGSTDEGDPVLLCTDVPNAVATSCDAGQCTYLCDTDWFNANDDWSDGCECQVTRNGEEWCDGVDNDCDGEIDGAGCRQCQNDADCDDGNPCTQNTCTAQRCETSNQPDGTNCDDGLYCTEPDGCSGGVCTGPGRDCSSLDTDCTQGDCNPVSEQCEPQSINQGGGCDDGLYCNVGETCSSGSCSGGNSRDCSSFGDQCNDGACNDTSDACEPAPKTDGTACDDLDACSSQDTCQGGTCTAGPTDLDADSDNFFDNQCPNGDDCDDGDGNVNPGILEGPQGDPTCSDSKDNDCDTTTDMNDDDCTGPTQIYRSVGPGNDLPLATGSGGNNLSISGSTATFDSPLPDNVGVGDAIQYDSDGNGSIDAISFIHRRASGTSYTVKNADGDNPVTVTTDDDWSVFRAYNRLERAERGSENSGLDDSVQFFEIWSGGKNLVAANQVWNIACYADDPETYTVDIDGWTTGPDNYLRIFTPVHSWEVGTSQRHNGKWDTGAYRITAVTASDYCSQIEVFDDYVRMDGLQFYLQTPYINYCVIYVDAGGEFHVSNSIFRGDATIDMSEFGGIGEYNSGGSVMKIYNNIIYDFWFPGTANEHVGVFIDTGSVQGYIYNNTVYDCRIGFVGNLSNSVLINNIANDCDDGYQSWNGNNSATDYNASDISGDFPGSNSRNGSSGNVSFRDTSGDDFHLSPTDNDAMDRGTDLSSDPDLAFSDDIDGDTRSGSWDIGADEHIPVPPTEVYRSVGRNASDLNVNSRSVVISGSTATFSGPMPDDVGVGDVLEYQASGAYQVAFIHGRTSDTVYTVKDADGQTPRYCASGTPVEVFRAYRYLDDWYDMNEAGSIDNDVENFDTSDNLVSLNVVMNVACYADGLDDDDVALYGWNTGPDNSIRIYTPTSIDEVGVSQRHDGTAGTGYVMGSDTTSGFLVIGEPYVTLEGLEIDGFVGNTEGAAAIVVDGVSNVSIDKVIVHNFENASYSVEGILVIDDGQATITNCLVYDGDTNGVGIMTWGSSATRANLYNTTVYDTGSGVGVDAGAIFAVNVVSMGNTGSDFYGQFELTSSNNLSADGSAPGNNSLTGLSASDQFESILSGSENFHLKTGADAINVGLPLSVFFNDDIDGENRSGMWDMGADEF